MKLSIVLLLLTAYAGAVFGQVTVGAGKEPEDFSVLEVTTMNADGTPGTRGGLRLPQLTTAERNAWRDYFLGANTGNPVKPSGSGVTAAELLNAPGLAIFNTDTKCYEYWNARRWVSLCEGNSLMTIGPGPCQNVAADGTGCDDEYTVTDPDCLNGPFTIIIVAGQDYAQLSEANETDGIFRIAFHPNNSVNQRSVVVRVTSSCTGLYKDFLFTQAGYDCDASLGDAPAITAVPSNFKFCADGAAYLSIDETQLSGSGTLADVIWTRNNIEVARGVSNIVVTQEGKYDVWMGYVGCNAGTGSSVTITRDGTGAPQPVSILVNGNNGMVCGPSGTTRLVAMNPNGSGTVLWFKNGILQDGTNGTDNITGVTVPGGIEVEVGVGNWFAVVQDGTCYSRPSETVVVIENPDSGGSLTAPGIEKGGTFCAGGSVLLSVSAGTYDASYTYIWYENNTQIGVGSSVLYTVPSGAESVVIRCRATQPGTCAQEALTVEAITTGTIPGRPAIIGNTVLCNGTTTLSIIPSGAGSFTYAWYKGNTLIGTTQQINITSGGDYYATVTDGCTSPKAHVNIPAASSTAPSVNFQSSAAVPGQANEGDIITYRATITFGPATGYIWTFGNATRLQGGGISDDYAVVEYGTAGEAAFVQVEVTNACGSAVGRREVATVGAGCEKADLTTLSPKTDQTKYALVGNSFTLGPVSVSFGATTTAYQWYRNTVKSTTGGTPAELSGMTNNTLIASEAAAGTYYYYCVMSNANNCGAPTVTSPFYTVTIIPDEPGTGTWAGKVCFDIAYSNFEGGCATEVVRTPMKTDFLNTVDEQDEVVARVTPFTGRQVYTFTPSGNVSNVWFAYIDPTGQAIESMTAKADYSGNISSGTTCKAVVVYKTTLDNDLRGKTRDEALKPELYVIYNDQQNGAGVNRAIKLTAFLQDCVCCGANTATGGWLTFMCHNLGADESLDPFSYVVGNADGSGGTLGYLYQWGRPTDGHEKRTSPTTTVKATDDTATAPAAVVGKFITSTGSPLDWVVSGIYPSRWGDGSDSENMNKAANDPCPPGWKVPSEKQWASISTSNTTPNIWNWQTNGYLVGNYLFLPNAGGRNGNNNNLVLIGSEGIYWSSSISDARGSYYLVLRINLIKTSGQGRVVGGSVRCTPE